MSVVKKDAAVVADGSLRKGVVCKIKEGKKLHSGTILGIGKN